MTVLELFFGFLKIGLFAFGGAYGAIPLIRDTVLSYGWIDEETLSYMIAVSESTPGPIMVNLATYIGNTRAGIIGALAATLGVVLPSFVLILLITAVLRNFIKNGYVSAFFGGLKPSVTGIVLATGAYMTLDGALTTPFDPRALIITAVLLACAFLSKPLTKRKISPILLIALSAILGVLLYGW